MTPEVGRDSSAIVITKDSALYKDDKYNGVEYNELYPSDRIYFSQEMDEPGSLRSNFQTDYMKDKNNARRSLVQALDNFNELNPVYQYNMVE